MRKIAFILAATDRGPLIMNRLDKLTINLHHTEMVQGVASLLLENGSDDADGEFDLYKSLLTLRHKYFGNGVHVIDCGANIGTMTIGLADHLRDIGTILAIEAQERLFYCLAGNIVLCNQHNARATWAAVGDYDGEMLIPQVDYLANGSYGSLELRRGPQNEHIGQVIDWNTLVPVKAMTIDSLHLKRLDLLKIDVERMEIDVLNGAKETISRCRPILAIEHLKIGIDPIAKWLADAGYEQYIVLGLMVIAIHPSDPTMQHVIMSDNKVGE